MQLIASTLCVLVMSARPPAAAAEFSDELSDAVNQARASSCGSLRFDPLITRAATAALHSTEVYLIHDARVVPVNDPLPILKDLGSGARRAKLINGAGRSEADSIKSTLIIGYRDIPDCSYTAYGVSTSDLTPSGYYLSALIMTDA
ncbi:hypothetical protein [Mycobacterium sp. Marseille-P9652]|uniref:hypothetical protein n=1 Tax=Mycobacterium sp. Marseille-P9652 TaxID=2654950 RepID=UPI0012E71751|nr:hypothetical protein [Mycobacterium sp. Marseille-P9652]